ncbi:MAG: hypothetical protein IJN92_08755 [Lachnospiraceae bacterium]|nr:hypothetical protein [Lachnospiraceae bacterium]
MFFPANYIMPVSYILNTFFTDPDVAGKVTGQVDASGPMGDFIQKISTLGNGVVAVFMTLSMFVFVVMVIIASILLGGASRSEGKTKILYIIPAIILCFAAVGVVSFGAKLGANLFSTTTSTTTTTTTSTATPGTQ